MPPTELKNDRLIRALFRQPVDVTPVWIMRQAGRYLPEYRATRAQAKSFMGLCQTPELACEVTLQPVRRFDLDAAIVFSDILTIPDAMGLGLTFTDGEGPRFERPLRTAADIARLSVPDPETELHYVLETIRLIQQELDGRIPLIGFSGSPWTLATYMVEGGSSRTFSRIKTLLYQEPTRLHSLLHILTDSVAMYLNAQIQAGVQVVMVFDTWGGILTEHHYREFSLRYLHYIVEKLTREVSGRRIPVILFTKGGSRCFADLATTGCEAVGVDWTVSLRNARQQVNGQVALQGNLDPCALYASPDGIRAEVARVLADFGPGNGHIFNLGHGIHPDIDPTHVNVLIEAVHALSGDYH